MTRSKSFSRDAKAEQGRCGSGGGAAPHAHSGIVKGNLLAGTDFASLARFNLTVDYYLPAINEVLGHAPTSAQAGDLEELMQLDVRTAFEFEIQLIHLL